MDKTVAAVGALGTVIAAIAISLNVTLPFIRRFSPQDGHYIPAIRIANFVAPYFDVCTALRIALTEPGARLPFAIIIQCLFLVAFPVFLYLYSLG